MLLLFFKISRQSIFTEEQFESTCYRIAGVSKFFIQRATFEKNVAAKGHTLSLQSRKVHFLCKKIHIHIKHSFCISHSGTFNAIYIVKTETYTIFMKFCSSSKTL